jgi:hypothetical protein
MTAIRELGTRADWNRHRCLARDETLSHVTKGISCLRKSQATLQTQVAESDAKIDSQLCRIRKGVDTVKSLTTGLSGPQATAAKNDCKATVLLHGSATDGATSLGELCHDIQHILLHSEPGISPAMSPDAAFWLLSQLHALIADVWAGEAHELAPWSPKLSCSGSQIHRAAFSDGGIVRRSSSWNILSPTVCKGISSRRRFPRSLAPAPFVETAAVGANIPTGKLFIIVKREFTEVGKIDSTGVISVGRILFVPAMGSSVAGITAVFVRCIDAMSRIPRTLSTFNVQQGNSPIIEYLKGGDVVMVRNMLSEHTVSPNDRDESGNSLLWVKVLAPPWPD